jgi:hypothetical protein
MSEERETQPGIATLRMKVATNHFKRLLLSDRHEPGLHQENTTLNELAPRCKDIDITGKTWKSWFESPQIVPRIGTIQTLDELASCAIRVVSKRDGEEKALPSEFFSQLVHGGLVKKMMQASKSKHPLIALRDRAESYKPISALHLHLDAIEVSALTEGYGDIPWETVKRIGAERILNILTDRWSPRHGSIYSELSSELRLKWDAASPEEQSEIRKNLARFRPDPFESIINARAIPDWNITGIDADISAQHIYKALFSLAADSKFLVADRLEAWSLDLASAALAMHALAWTDRFTTFDQPISDELIFWCAFDDLMFRNESIDLDNRDFVGAMTKCNSDWSPESFGLFLSARETYHGELKEVGISMSEVIDIAMQATKTHPLVLRN